MSYINIPQNNPAILELTKLLNKNKITPLELAIHLHITPTRIYEIIKGKRRFTYDTDLRISHFFKIAPRHFLDLQTLYEFSQEAQSIKPLLSKLPNIDTFKRLC